MASVREVLDSEDVLGVYPDRETYGSSETAYCLMFYDWPEAIGPDWLEFAEVVFSQFGGVIVEGTGGVGDQRSHGAFRRVRKRLDGFLRAVRNGAKENFDIRLRSDRCEESNAFFPSTIEMVWSLHASGRKNGMVAVRQGLVDGLETLLQKVSTTVFDKTGPAYAYAIPFPTLFDPSAYLATVVVVPRGGSTLSNKNYGERLTRFRDNWWSGLLPSQGHLREVYPINFVLDSHLSMPFQDRPLSEYMENVGKLQPTEYSEKVYRWTVPGERLSWVRQDLEPSGLILSSSYPPLRSPRRLGRD